MLWVSSIHSVGIFNHTFLTPIGDDAVNFPAAIATPIDAITVGEGPTVPVNIIVGTIGNSLPIASTSTTGASNSMEAAGSVIQTPPLKKRRTKE